MPRPHFGCSVARLGGDEFTVLLTDLDDADVAERVARRLLESLRQPVLCAGHEVFATVSIGIAMLSARRQRRRHAGAQGRHRDVLGQGIRPQRLARL